MSDITTVEEVQAEDYTVRVAQTDDGSAWEAVVVDDGGSSSSGYTPVSLPAAVVMGPQSGPDDGDNDEPIGPVVEAPHRWVAVGLAVEAHEWGEIGEDAVDPEEVYEHGQVVGAGPTLEEVVQEITGNVTGDER